MLIKSYPCHGWVIDRTQLRRAEVVNDRVMSGNYFEIVDGQVKLEDESLATYYWFIESGHHTHKNLATGEVTDCVRGWNTVDTPHVSGDYLMNAEEATTVWCFNSTSNESLPSSIEFIRLAPGQSRSFSDGDKLFVFDGSFSVDGKTVSGPRQISVSGSKTVTAVEDSMMILVG